MSTWDRPEVWAALGMIGGAGLFLLFLRLASSTGGGCA